MRTCSVPGCNKKHRAKGYCRQHLYQIQKHGKITSVDFDRSNKTRKCRNSIHVFVESSKGKRFFVIDKADAWILSYRGYICSQGYPMTTSNGRRKRLHQVLNPEWKMTDHINIDKLDNRRVNLRECTAKENTWNKGISTKNKSGVTGVHFNKLRNRWIVQMPISGKTKCFGSFVNLDEAVYIRKKIEREYRGNFASV